MLITRRQSVAVIAALFLTLQTAWAYHYPLSSEAIRDAYFLGERNNFQTTDCLLQYTHRFSAPQNGGYFISQIDISSPYQQIVLRGQRNMPGDSELQTETDLAEHPLNVIVRVRVELNVYNSNNKYGAAFGPALSGNVSLEVTQRNVLTPVTVTHEGLYNHHALVGWLFELQFDPAKITSAPLRISVKTPDGQVEEAKFDMAKLQ
ncbi:MAG: hypothetical protein ACRD4A_00470 [Candidatus Acidiferrales bacterium]